MVAGYEYYQRMEEQSVVSGASWLEAFQRATDSSAYLCGVGDLPRHVHFDDGMIWITYSDESRMGVF